MENKINASDQFYSVPIHKTLNLKLISAENGHAKITYKQSSSFNNIFGMSHGGVLMTLLDSVMSNAARSKISSQTSALTINMNTNFIQPGTGILTASARVIRAGTSLCFCEGEILNEDNSVVATATATFKYTLPK